MNQDVKDILDDLQDIVDGVNVSGMLEVEVLVQFLEQKRSEFAAPAGECCI